MHSRYLPDSLYTMQDQVQRSPGHEPVSAAKHTLEVPDLPGCVTEGDDLIDAIETGTDAASGWILGEIENGSGYPQARTLDQIDVSEGSFASCLVLDMDAYAERYGSREVRRNITIPAWLDTYVKKNDLSLSRIVQDSLLKLAKK